MSERMDSSNGGRTNRSDSISMPYNTESPTCSRRTDRDGTRDGRQNVSRHQEDQHIPPHQRKMSERDAYHHMSIEQNGRFDSTTPEPQQSPHHEQEARPSDMEIYHDLLQILEEVAPDESDLVHPFQVASLVPPITHESLGELDIARIINNPKLRHDVNFDRELHFRPNTDGSRGKIKQQTSRDYWDALTAELILYNQVGARLLQCDNLLGQEQFVRMMEMAQKRMPGILETVKEVLKSLVPERDQARVNDRLDIPVIMQQISKGVFDLMDLAQWLSKLLKDHCAPMRDEWIDRMVEMTQQGVVEGSPHGIVEGMRELLSILESMKLVCPVLLSQLLGVEI